MISFIQCVKGRSGLSIPEFREHWHAYAAKAKALAEATGAVGLVVNTTLAVEQNLQVRLSRGTAEPYDGVLKLSWPNAAGLGEGIADPKVAAVLEDLRKHQELFIDLDRSRFFFAAEETLLSGNA
jgi:hypothetical protein